METIIKHQEIYSRRLLSTLRLSYIENIIDVVKKDRIKDSKKGNAKVKS